MARFRPGGQARDSSRDGAREAAQSQSVAIRLGETFGLTPQQYAILSALLDTWPESETPHIADLARASGTPALMVRTFVSRLVEARWALSWYDNEVWAAQNKRPVRQFVEMTDIGTEQARKALHSYEPPPEQHEPGEHADIAHRLGQLLQVVRERSGLTGARIAGYGNRSQPWWSRLTSGMLATVDLDSVQKIATALAPPWQADRIMALASALNSTPEPPRNGFISRGARAFRELENDLLRAKKLLVSSPDTIPVQLWCDDFAQAMAAGLPPDHGEALLLHASRWRSRVGNKRVRVTWLVGEAALYRTYGLRTETVIAQLEHMESLTPLRAERSHMLLGVVPFDAEISTQLPALRIADDKRAALDFPTGLVRMHGPEVPQFVTYFEALPAVWVDEAAELLRRARSWHETPGRSRDLLPR